jgi:hypothetical protein
MDKTPLSSSDKKQRQKRRSQKKGSAAVGDEAPAGIDSFKKALDEMKQQQPQQQKAETTDANKAKKKKKQQQKEKEKDATRKLTPSEYDQKFRGQYAQTEAIVAEKANAAAPRTNQTGRIGLGAAFLIGERTFSGTDFKPMVPVFYQNVLRAKGTQEHVEDAAFLRQDIEEFNKNDAKGEEKELAEGKFRDGVISVLGTMKERLEHGKLAINRIPLLTRYIVPVHPEMSSFKIDMSALTRKYLSFHVSYAYTDQQTVERPRRSIVEVPIGRDLMKQIMARVPGTDSKDIAIVIRKAACKLKTCTLPENAENVARDVGAGVQGHLIQRRPGRVPTRRAEPPSLRALCPAARKFLFERREGGAGAGTEPDQTGEGFGSAQRFAVERDRRTKGKDPEEPRCKSATRSLSVTGARGVATGGRHAG